jgi:hypothetical protein
MAVAFDAATQSDEWFSTTPDTQTHTPVGTPRGAAIFVLSHGSDTSDAITGASYGALALSDVGLFAIDASTEPCTAKVFFGGASIPTGAQSCTVTQSGGSGPTRRFYVMTWTAADDTEVVDSDKVEENQADPGATLDSGSRTASRAGAVASGRPTTDIAPTAGTTADFETAVAADVRSFHLGHQTTPGTGSTSISWTAPSDDAAGVFIAVSEILAAGGGGATVVRSLSSLGSLRSLVSL